MARENMVNEHGYEIAVYIVITFAIILAFIVLNWTFTFYKLWSELNVPAISVRRPRSVLLFGVLCIIALLIRNPTQIWFSLNAKLFNDMFWLQLILLHLTTVGMNYIILYRSWMVYYHIKWNKALEDAKWESKIDTKTFVHSWYIRKRKIWGNPKTVSICLFVPWSFCCVLGTIAAFVSTNTIALLSVVINIVIGITLLCILSFKMPKYNDHYKIRKETQMLSISYCILIIAMFALTFIIGTPIGTIKYILLQVVHMGILFILTMFSFFWVFKTFHLPNNLYSLYSYKIEHEMSEMPEMSPEISHAISIEKDNLTFDKVFSVDEIFSDFARHLCKEFAIESLLFFVETHQFIKYMHQLLNENNNEVPDEEKKMQLYNISLAENVPQSTIVNELKQNINNNEKYAVYIAAINLFLKYIDLNAYFVINISYETRQLLSETFVFENNNNNNNGEFENMKDFMFDNNITNTQICHVFDEARREIRRLLSLTFLRFKHAKY